MIRNRINGKVYVGSAARGFSGRWGMHRHDLRHNKHHSSHLQISWNKYKEQNFEFVVLARCSPEWCLAIEQIYLNKFRSYHRDFGYNLAPIAGSCLGTKRTPEQTARNRARQKGRKQTKEFCLKMAIAMKRRMIDPIERAKIDANLALAHTAENRAKSNQGKKRYWENPNPDHIIKFRMASRSPSANLKRSLKTRGVPHSPEHLANLIAANKKRAGLKMSDEARSKMSASAKLRLSRHGERERMKAIGELGRSNKPLRSAIGKKIYAKQIICPKTGRFIKRSA